MDPLEGVQVHHDSTFALMLECQRRGHAVSSFEQKDLYFQGGKPSARMRRVSVQRKVGDHFSVLATEDVPLSELDGLFLRKDPPVDVEFVHATQLVELAAGPGGPFLINSPQGLRNANEKLFALKFSDLQPPTLVSRHPDRLRAFILAQERGAILKPIDGFGGKAVLHTLASDPNLNALLEMATDGGRQAIIAQSYLPDVRTGDKRIILVNGEPVGAVLRVPRDGDVRANLAVGGQAVKTSLTDRDREICRRIAPTLREHGLYFVGIDVIGAHLIEINVTSPTGIAEIDQLDGVSIERRVMDFAEQHVRR